MVAGTEKNESEWETNGSGGNSMSSEKNICGSMVGGGCCHGTFFQNCFVMIVAISLWVFHPSMALAKGGDTLWGVADSQAHRQEALASVVDSTGSVIVTGYRNIKYDTNDDYWTVKFNTDGSIAWRAVFDRAGGSDQAMAVAVDSNNDVIVTGSVWNGQNKDIYTVKYNGITGAIVWSDLYNSPANGNDVGTAIVVDSINNVVYVGGYTQNAAGNDDYLLVRYQNPVIGPANPPLSPVLAYNGPANGLDRIASISVGANGVAVTGHSWNGSDFDMLTIKYDLSGAKLWERRYSSIGSHGDFGRFVKMDPAGNVVITGTAGNDIDYDIYTAKYAAADGAVLWQQTYDGAFDDEPAGLAVDVAGDVYVTGYTWTLAGANDFYTAKYSSAAGSLLWQQIFDSGKANSDIATATGIVVENSVNGGVYVTGYTETAGNFDFQTVKYMKGNGHLIWHQSYNGEANHNDRTVGIGLAPNGNVYVTGWTDRTKPLDNGPVQASGGSSGTISVSGKSWAADQWKDFFVMVTSGANINVVRQITGNTADTITVAVDFGSLIAAGDSLYIFDKDDYDYYVIRYDQGDLNPPTNLLAEAVAKAANSTYTVRLSWEDNAADEDGFIIERKLGEYGSWGEIARVGANITSYDNPGLIENNYYYYRIKSYRGSQESYPCDESHVLTMLVSYAPPLWQYAYNSSHNLEDYATSIGVGPDDNPVVTGRSDSGLVGMFDYYTVKLNHADKSLIWADRYDSMQNQMDQAVCLAVDNNNDVIVSGFSDQFYAPVSANINSILTLKYPAAGPPAVWEKLYNGPGGIDDRATTVASVTDGSSTAVVGYGKNIAGNDDIYVVKYLANGTQLWAALPYDGGRNDYPAGVAMDGAGNVIVTGYRQNASGLTSDMHNYDMFTSKYDAASGNRIWTDTYNVTGTGDNKATGVVVDLAGDVYITGYATNAAGNEDFYTIKYSGSNGSRIWERPYDGPAHGDDRAVAIRIDPVTGSNPLDGNIVVLGTQGTAAGDQDIQLIRYSTAGEIRWERTLQRPHINDSAVAMAMDTAGYIYIAGDTGDLDRDIISVIYDYEGTLLGGTTFNGGNGFDQASAITVNHQGEAFIAGYTTNASGNADYVVYKQKNNYILAPTPFQVAGQALYSQLQLAWRNNSPNTSIVIDRTLGPVTSNSTWVNRASFTNPAPTAFMDTGLTAGTQYCYRIEAFSGTLPSRKIITCATTTLPKPLLTPATAVTPTQLTLSWGNFPGNTGYTVERKIGAGGWEVHPNGNLAANITTFTDTGLTSGTQYTYRIITNNPGGSSLPSDDKIVWTLPLAPPNPNFSSSWAQRVDISWGNVVGETGYRIERKSTGTWSTVATVGTDVLSYSDTTAVANTQYYYRVASFNLSGDSFTGEGAVKTKELPAQLNAAATPAAGTINLSWNDLANETAYIVQESYCQYPSYDPNYYCNNNFYTGTYWTGWVEVARTAANTTSVSRTGLTSGNEYRYRVIAEVPGNTTEPSNLKGAWTWISPAPTLTVSPASETSLALSWNDISGETGYEVWRKQGQAGTWGKLTDIAFNGTSYTNSGLLAQTEYCYQVKAVNTAVNADALAAPPSPSNEVCLPTPLPAPVLTTPTVQSTTQLTLFWSTIPGSNGYELERCRYSDPDNPQNAPSYITNASYWVECSTVAVAFGETSYVSSGLTAGYTYRYRIRDLYGTTPIYSSAWSNNLLAATLPSAPTIAGATSPGGSQMTVNWNNVAGETSYKLEWKARTGADCSTGSWNTAIVIGQNATTYTQSGLATATYYCYQIKAANSWGDSAYSNVVSQSTALSAPVLNPPSSITTSSVTLTWSNLSGNTGYKLWRKAGSSGTYALLATLAANVTSYTDGTLSAGSYYGYQLEALNTGGSSARSNEQAFTATPAATTLTATPKSTSTIELSWPLRFGATNYKVERKLGSGGSWGEVANISATYTEDYCGAPVPTVGCQALSPGVKSYQDQSLQANTTYCYQLRAWNSTGGNAAYSTPERCITTSSLPSVSLTAVPVNAFSVKLDWVPQVCNGGSCEAPDGYEVEKRLGSNGFTRVATVANSPVSYVHRNGLDPGTTYSYRVRSYRGLLESFDTGINPASWGEQGVVYTSAGAVASNVTVPPINIAGINGISRISAVNGAVQLQTSSPGGGVAGNFNYSLLKMLDVTRIHDNFDVQIDFSLPDLPGNAAQYHVYGRLQIELPTVTGLNYAYVERSNSGYGARIVINDVLYSSSLATSDTIGKLKLSRMGDVISAYAWTGGKWVVIKEIAGSSTGAATSASLGQFAQRNEAITLKIILDNYEATTQRPAYSNEATATTPAFTQGATTCQ